MDQKDIDKLLICRKIMDEFRKNKDLAREMGKDNKQIFYDTHDILIKKLKEDLQKYDFFDPADFYKFNMKMKLQARKEFAPIEGYCDLCEGKFR